MRLCHGVLVNYPFPMCRSASLCVSVSLCLIVNMFCCWSNSTFSWRRSQWHVSTPLAMPAKSSKLFMVFTFWLTCRMCVRLFLWQFAETRRLSHVRNRQHNHQNWPHPHVSAPLRLCGSAIKTCRQSVHIPSDGAGFTPRPMQPTVEG